MKNKITIKQMICTLMSLAMLVSLSVSTYAAEPVFVQSVSKISDKFQNEDGCTSEFVEFETAPRQPNIAEPATFDLDTFIQNVSKLSDDFQNEEECSSEFVSFEANSLAYEGEEIPVSSARATNPPSTFYNIALKGIYKGSFSDLRGTMYTNYYFDTKDGTYYSRVSCYGEYPDLCFKVGNYCKDCKKVISITEDSFPTPSTPYEHSQWLSIVHTLGGTHKTHMVCPFVVNDSGLINDQLYAIGGNIWVNYENTWN